MKPIKIKEKFHKHSYEKEYWQQSKFVCGIDEVGRSCLAGPVVAAAAILTTQKKSHLIKDSKILTSEERVEAYNWLIKNSIFAVGIINHRIIDKVNIYQSTLYAMNRALMQLLSNNCIKPSIILIDAMPLSINIDIPVHFFNKGEDLSISIAAASIIAKVTRDRLMERSDAIIPGYAFNSNKGYGTPIHKKELKNNNSSIIHRSSFIKSL